MEGGGPGGGGLTSQGGTFIEMCPPPPPPQLETLPLETIKVAIFDPLLLLQGVSQYFDHLEICNFSPF